MQAPNNSPASPATSACSPATAAEPQGGAPADCPSPQEQIQTEKRFINDAAHQLRTPLAGIISQAELALQETDLQQLHQRVRKIHAAAQRGAQIVRQMLALARSEDRSAHNRSPETYDLAELAREVTREWIPKSLTLDKDLGYEGLHTAMVRGNRFMMREAISNLIDNALSYTPTNAVITVSVRYGAAQGTAAAHAAKPAQAAAPRIVAISGDLDNRGKAEQTAQQPAAHTAWQAMPPRQEDGQTPAPAAQAPIASPVASIILEVADNGPGVAAEQLPHVFERFWRADDETTHGSGLGLALVARIAEQHGGTATAHQAEPHGFIVRLALPEAAATP